MAQDLNSVAIIGRLTGDPKFYVNNDELKIVGFAIANNRHVSQKEMVSFINCKAFGKLAEIIGKHCHKGQQVAIQGRLQQETWEKEGVKKNDVAIMVNEIEFLSSPKKTQETQEDFFNTRVQIDY